MLLRESAELLLQWSDCKPSAPDLGQPWPTLNPKPEPGVRLPRSQARFAVALAPVLPYQPFIALGQARAPRAQAPLR